MSFNSAPFGVDDMWASASGEVEQEHAKRAMAHAMERTANLTSMLYGSVSEADLDNRLSLVASHLKSASEETGADLAELTATHRRQALLAVEATRKQAAYYVGHDADEYAAVLNDTHNAQHGAGHEFEVKSGPKYTKIVQHSTVDGKRPSNSGSAHAFIENETGLVHKPAGWSRPAPGARFDLQNTSSREDLMRSLRNPSSYTGGYLRRSGSVEHTAAMQASVDPMARIAAIKRALDEGQNPLLWVAETDGGEGQAEKPSESGNQAFLDGDYVTPQEEGGSAPKA